MEHLIFYSDVLKMKVGITDIYYIKGADDEERVKVAYLININGTRIVGQVFMDPFPADTLQERVPAVVEEDLSTKKEIIDAVVAAHEAYVGQEIDVTTLLDKPDPSA